MSSEPGGLRVGKPPLLVLDRLLQACRTSDPRVVVGPRVGEDAAVLDLGDRYLVATADPVTFTAEEIGWYAVHVNANDLATRGARPAWFLMTLLLPEGAGEALLEAIFCQVREACATVGATLVGGHTEVTQGLPRPILAGAMLGEVAKDHLVSTAGARPGDVILLSKGVAIEGSAILARECEAVLAERGVSPEDRARARELLRRPGISVLPDAEAARAVARVHAMHDPTEGGVATGLLELALASGVGVRVDRAAIPVLPACRAICAALGVDPLGLIASGALLAACEAEEAQTILRAWQGAGIDGTAIGRVTAAEAGCRLVEDGSEIPLPRFARDEIARVFERGGAVASRAGKSRLRKPRSRP
ncbi:MAG TPA: AIR synthase family protein [Candidatus Sulfotelmatobacter sp.]|nr:AIR synthase family protein [Candidatus Sulfotelmatobacter sp.]